jgi:thiol-disulfide isomerase/thioredoxin
MKRIVTLLSIVCAYPCISNAQQAKSMSRFTLTGTITELNTKFLSLQYQDQNGKWVDDTCYLKNNTFAFSGTINRAYNAELIGHTKSKSSDDPNFTTIFLEPGEIKVAMIENDFKNSKITGSHTQEEVEMIERRKKPDTKIENELNIELGKIYKAIQNGDTSTAIKNKRDILVGKTVKYKELDKQIDYAFMSSHPGSYLSPYLMDYYFETRKLPLDSAGEFFAKFDTSVQGSFYGESIKSQIIARKSSATGNAAPLFSKPDTDGKPVSLESFKGKSYVLLDFWASWCVPCRVLTPRLKEFYQKYHARGLDIISISWDSDKKAWLDAINKDNTKIWYNVFANIYQPLDNGLRGKYAIASIPTLILIDKNGMIIGRYRGDGEDGDETTLSDKLNKIFTGN